MAIALTAATLKTIVWKTVLASVLFSGAFITVVNVTGDAMDRMLAKYIRKVNAEK